MISLVAKNYIYQLGVQIINLIVPLITLPYVTKVLMPDGYGFYTYSFTVVSYIVLVGDFGIRIYGIRAIAYAKAISDKQVSIDFSSILILRVIIVSILTLASLFYFLFIGNHNKIIYLFQLLNLFAIAFDISWFYQGIEHFKKVAIRNTILKIIYLISVYLFIKSQNDLEIYTLLVGSIAVASNLAFFIGLKKYVCFAPINELHFKVHFYNSLKLFVPQIAIGIYATISKVMLGDLTSNTEVGLYDVAYKIVMIGMMLITTAGTVLMPKISGLFAVGRNNEAKALIAKSIEILCLFGFAISAGIFATSSNIVTSLFSSDYTGVIPILQILSLAVICWTVNNVTGNQILIPLKRERYITISVLVGLVVNVFLNYLLIPTYSAKGAALSAFITEIVVTGIQLRYSFLFFRSVNNTSIVKYAFSAIGMYFIVLPVENLVMQILLGFVVYFLSLILLGENRTILGFRFILERVKRFRWRI